MILDKVKGISRELEQAYLFHTLFRFLNLRPDTAIEKQCFQTDWTAERIGKPNGPMVKQ